MRRDPVGHVSGPLEPRPDGRGGAGSVRRQRAVPVDRRVSGLGVADQQQSVRRHRRSLSLLPERRSGPAPPDPRAVSIAFSAPSRPRTATAPPPQTAVPTDEEPPRVGDQEQDTGRRTARHHEGDQTRHPVRAGRPEHQHAQEEQHPTAEHDGQRLPEPARPQRTACPEPAASSPCRTSERPVAGSALSPGQPHARGGSDARRGPAGPRRRGPPGAPRPAAPGRRRRPPSRRVVLPAPRRGTPAGSARRRSRPVAAVSPEAWDRADPPDGCAGGRPEGCGWRSVIGSSDGARRGEAPRPQGRAPGRPRRHFGTAVGRNRDLDRWPAEPIT